MEVMRGACACGAVKFQLTASPIVVHACHCRDCQRLSGSAFVLNAVIEASNVELLSGEPGSSNLEAATGKAHVVSFCRDCGTYVWSQYLQLPSMRFVRVGTLDEPDALSPPVHIWTSRKQAWVEIPPGLDVYPEFYSLKELWSDEALQRLKASIKAAG